MLLVDLKWFGGFHIKPALSTEELNNKKMKK